MAGNWFYPEELFIKIRSYQMRNWKNEKVKQHSKRKLISLDHNKWDWADHQYAEWFMCNHTQVYVQMSDFYNQIG